MIDSIPGLRVGHVTHEAARTGCTVVLVDVPVVASGEVRGGAPATREFALLDPLATVESIDAVMLSGGSAFGLAAADGAMAWLDEAGRGFETAWGHVPIVVAMSLFDLAVGDAAVRPSASDGHAAAARAAESDTGVAVAGVDGEGVRLGSIGAGAGATVSKWRGEDVMREGGLVGSVQRHGDVVVAVLVAVNAWGDVVGSPEADLPTPDLPGPQQDSPYRGDDGGTGAGDVGDGGRDGGASGVAGHTANTTIGVVATNAIADKLTCMHMARGAHDGLARAVSPPHCSVDGDAFVTLATGEVPASQEQLRWMAVQAVEAAIRAAGHPSTSR